MSPWRYLWRAFVPALGAGLLAIVLLAITWIAGIALLALSGWFIAASALAGAGLLVGLDIFTPSTGIRGAAVARTLARYGERLVGHHAVLTIMARLRATSFQQIAALPLQRQQALRSGDLQSRLTADIDLLDAALLRVIGPLSAAILALASAVLLAAALGTPLAAWLLAVSGSLTLGASMVIALAGRRAGRRWVVGRSRQRVAVLDHVGGLAELRAYQREARSLARLQRIEAIQSRRVLRRERAAMLGEQGVHAIVLMATVLMLLLALQAWRDGLIAAPVAVLLPLMTLGLNEVLGSLPGACFAFGETRESARRLAALSPERTVDIADGTAIGNGGSVRPAPGGASAVTDGLAWRNLQVGIDGRALIHPVSAQLQAGEPLLLMGPSGCGKSRLLATLLGELAPLAGSISLQGRPLHQWSDRDRYGRIALLPQETLLLDDTIAGNLRVAAPEADEAALWHALWTVDLDDWLHATQAGLQLRTGELGAALSGGQARRLALAVVVLQDAPVVLLDEPFAGLDEATEARVLARLLPWLQRRQVVIASHTPERLPLHWPRCGLTSAA